MAIESFDDDLFGLKPFAERLEKFIAREKTFVDNSLVVALCSQYGSGKTTFLDMWSEKIDNQPVAGSGKGLIAVRLNAWESDYYGDPLFAIVSALAKAFDNHPEARGRSERIKKAVKEIAWGIVAIGGQFAKQKTGFDITAAGRYVEDKTGGGISTVKMSSPFEVFENRRNAMESLKEAIATAIADIGSDVIFMVDELDRCRPDYAIQYIETIKHIFDIKNAVFVLSVDREQLRNSAVSAFGKDLDFDEYLRKFVHREVELPGLDSSAIAKLIHSCFKKYVSVPDRRFSRLTFDNTVVRRLTEMHAACGVTPRQTMEIFRVLGYFMEFDNKPEGELKTVYAAAVIAASCLRIASPLFFDRVKSGSISPDEVMAFFNNRMDASDATWWFNIFAGSGQFGHPGEPEVAENLRKACPGYNDFASGHRGFDHMHGKILADICNKIESLDRL